MVGKYCAAAMSSKTQTNRDLPACVFPSLEPFTGISSNSDWFIALFASVVIGQNQICKVWQAKAFQKLSLAVVVVIVFPQ